MKKISLLILACLFLLVSCIHCPPKDVVFPVDTPWSRLLLQMEKGTFDKEHEGEQWMSLEDFKKQLEQEMQKELNEEKNRAI